MSLERPNIPKHIQQMLSSLKTREKRLKDVREQIDLTEEVEFPQFRETDLQRLNVVTDRELEEMEDDTE